jgi:hypothetical protein
MFIFNRLALKARQPSEALPAGIVSFRQCRENDTELSPP